MWILTLRSQHFHLYVGASPSPWHPLSSPHNVPQWPFLKAGWAGNALECGSTGRQPETAGKGALTSIHTFKQGFLTFQHKGGLGVGGASPSPLSGSLPPIGGMHTHTTVELCDQKGDAELGT